MSFKDRKKGLKKFEHLLFDVIFSCFLILLLLFFVRQADVLKTQQVDENNTKGFDDLLKTKENTPKKDSLQDGNRMIKDKHLSEDKSIVENKSIIEDKSKTDMQGGNIEQSSKTEQDKHDGNTFKSQRKLININQADEEELKELNGIGDELAKRIVQYRKKHGEFKKISDLKRVNGIGDLLYVHLHE